MYILLQEILHEKNAWEGINKSKNEFQWLKFKYYSNKWGH